MAVGYFYPVGGESKRLEVDVLQYLLYFVDMRMQGAVGCHQTVGAEVGIVDDAHEAHVASKGPDVSSGFILDGKGLVHPIPDEAAL